MGTTSITQWHRIKSTRRQRAWVSACQTGHLECVTEYHCIWQHSNDYRKSGPNREHRSTLLYYKLCSKAHITTNVGARGGTTMTQPRGVADTGGWIPMASLLTVGIRSGYYHGVATASLNKTIYPIRPLSSTLHRMYCHPVKPTGSLSAGEAFFGHNCSSTQ